MIPPGRLLRRPSSCSVCIAALSLLVLLGLMPAHEIGTYDLESDFYGRYLPEAGALLSGEPRFFPFSGPGYPVVMGCLGRLFGDPFRGAKLLSALSAAIASVAAFRLGSRLASPGVGLWLQGLLLLGSARFAVLASTETFFLALACSALSILLRRPAPTAVGFFVTGALAGWATITRYNGVFLLVFGLALAGWPALSPMPLKRRLLGALWLCAGFFVASGWWWVLNARWNGSPVASKVYLIAASVLHGRGVGDLEDLASVEPRYHGLAGVLLDDPARVLTALAGNVGVRAWDLAVGVAQPPAAVFGLWGLLALRDPVANRRLLVAGALGFLPLLLAPRGTRYALPLLPIVYAYAAVGLSRFVEGNSLVGAVGKRTRWMVAASVPVLLAATSAWKFHQYISTEPRDLLGVAETLRGQRNRETALVIARKPHLAAIARMRGGWPAGFHDLTTFVESAEGMGADYLFVGDRETMVAPFLDPLRSGVWERAGWTVLSRDPSLRWSLYERARR